MLKNYFSLPLLLLVSMFSLNVSASLNAREEATELIALMDYEKQINLQLEQILELQVKLKPDMIPFKEPMRAFFQKYLSYEAIKPQLIEVYAEAFSAKELHEMNEFYKSPTGKKAISFASMFSEKSREIAEIQLIAHSYELNQMIKEHLNNNPNETSKGQSLKLVSKLKLDGLLYDVAYNHSKSSQFYRFMINKIGEQNTKKIIKEELFKAAPKYQDWWNNQLASSIEESIGEKEILDLAVNGTDSMYAKEFDRKLSEIVMSVLRKDGELMSELTTKIMKAAFYERMN